VATPELPAHIQALLSPSAYPHPVERVELRQTHISYLFFAGDLVYKVKKPLDLGFLDFSTLERRRHFCEEEQRLNRRLCEGTYLDVVPVVQSPAGVRVEGAGEVIDYAVKMRRLPEEGMMSALLEGDAVDSRMLAALARRIADFHASSERSAEIDAFGGLETAMGNWRENFEQTAPYIGRTVSQAQFQEIKAYVEEVAELDADVFALRVQEGRARDCHGDLRADAVVFEDDHVCIFDCIEFNERFRYSDLAADVAFLAMDLDYRGRGDLADEFLGLYLAATLDATLPLVLNFYRCYRAYVRGKVDGFQLDQPEVSDEQKALVQAGCRRYFELAHDYATRPAPRALIITVGVSGSGKSYLANALATRLGAFVVSSDVTRKGLLGIDPAERHIDPIDAGIYAPEVTERTYAAMLDAARPWLQRGKPVILDASYLDRERRRAALALSYDTNAGFLALECEADEAVIWERLSERQGDQRVVSDGRWEVYRVQQERREPVDELPVGAHMVVDAAQPLREQIAAVLAHLAGGPPEPEPESGMGSVE
jgi:aminoglycoside phosphotransferase family enzyme/predicted kinase